MDTGTYTAASALLANLKAQEVTAHNLANVNTPGYKRRLALFHPFHEHLAAEGAAHTGTEVEGIVVDFRSGPIEQTGTPLDLALDCEGFFVLSEADGYVYTRQGRFTLDAAGRFVDSVGRPLVAEGGGEITVPLETKAITVDREGQVSADGTSLGRLWIVDVAPPRALVPAGYTAFATPADVVPQTVAQPRVVQGALEGSNTNPIDELVTMITTLRSYEAAQRSLTAIDETTEQLAATAQSTP